MSQAIEQIKSINHHLRHAIEQVEDAIWIIEPRSRHPLGPQIVFANRAAAEVSGHSREQMREQPIGLVYEPESLNHLLVRLPSVARTGKVYEMEKELVTRSGDRVPCRWTVSAVKGASGGPVNFIFTAKPLGVRAPDEANAPAEPPKPENGEGDAKPTRADPSLEEGLEKSRVESLALLAGGIAHDFNNVLQTIVTNLSLAKLETAVHAPGRQFIDDAMEATKDAQSLAQQILDFTKGREPVIQVANLADEVRSVAKLSTMGSKVRCDITAPEGLWGVDVDLRQIRQVIHNLMVNACQSMPSGGVVQAFVENLMIPEERKYRLPPGPYVVIRIRDRGMGIPPEKIEKIFEPYFTTKESGTGIGLATCRAIVQRHNGTITVSSKVNAGTEFRVYLPACQIFEEAGKREEGANLLPSVSKTPATMTPQGGGNGSTGSNGLELPEGVIGGEGRILVVDDQDSVREAAERLLRRLGYDTIAAATGQEAVSLFEQYSRTGNPIHAVLLDMTLPGGLNGDEVMQEIREMDHDARVIATSGYFDDDAESAFRRDGYVGILPKPYAVDRLSQTLALATQN